MIRVRDTGDGQHHQDGQWRDRDQQESALFAENGPAFAPGQRTTQSDARSERRTEDMAQKDGQNRPQHGGHDAPKRNHPLTPRAQTIMMYGVLWCDRGLANKEDKT
jgi:hypothetical protein